MGSFLSYPLVKAPDSYDLPESESEDEDQTDLSSEVHKVNLRSCKHTVWKRMRSRNEQTRFDEYRQNWNDVVMKLKENSPQWTPEDLLNLRHQFEVFDKNVEQLLDYNELNTALDFIQDQSSPEQRRAMFESVDTHQSNSINFEEYLQLMNNITIGTPVPRAPKTEDDKDPAIMNIISGVAKADPFSQMCYGLF
ncbi:uncharacterized protein si:ch211-122l24.6 [Myxocyprinus asiaticus]|uniref:uncharacterized protein si:ch211-122l24.6 n=1 Tax=Myxocyprinus asiaticus TaxID=70543 RepID=UPI0022212D34|nr:uncharacterized protein si:ch211-122l24.6 [Myxocyprinus asiaticus]